MKQLVKLETSCTEILSPTASVSWFKSTRFWVYLKSLFYLIIRPLLLRAQSVILYQSAALVHVSKSCLIFFKVGQVHKGAMPWSEAGNWYKFYLFKWNRPTNPSLMPILTNRKFRLRLENLNRSNTYICIWVYYSFWFCALSVNNNREQSTAVDRH